MAKTAILGGVAGAKSTNSLDAVAAAPRDTLPPTVASPMALMLPRAASAPVAVTSKRGERSDSANLSERRVAGAAARADARAMGVVEGRVIDKKNEQGVSGASVTLGPALGATTDKDGRFSVTNVPAGEQHVIVRRIGYMPQTVSITVPDDASVTATVALEPQVMSLSQVVVTGGAARGIAAATAQASVGPGPSLRAISVDSSAATRRTVYEISPGVRVTLVDTLEDNTRGKAAFGQSNGRVAGVAQQPANESDEKASTHAISWTDHGHRYELSGPVSVQTLEALKQRLIAAKR